MALKKELFEIKMHVYSGRSDPSWFIEDAHPRFNELSSRVRTHSSSELPTRLGYRGFTITRKVTDTTGNLRNTAYPISVSGNIGFETFLLETATELGDDIKKHAFEMIHEQDNQDDDFHIIQETHPSDLPKYEPAKWNNPIHLVHNNSYNYCVDIITDTNAVPGRATKHIFPDPPQGIYIREAALSDGLKIVHDEDPNNIPDYQWNLVALTFWPPADPQASWDYHFYRLDDPGRHWSHKPGRTPVTNLDNSGKTIADPRYCNRGPYTEFVCFMQTEKDKVSII